LSILPISSYKKEKGVLIMEKKNLADALRKQSEKYGFPTVKENKTKKDRVKTSKS